MIAGGADIYVKRWQQYEKELEADRLTKKVAAGVGGTPAAREPGLGTGRVGT